MVGECIPEVGGGDREGPVPPGAVLGLSDLQEVGFAGPEGAGGDVWFEEIGEIRRCQVIEGFVGGDKDFEVNSLLDGEPV